MDPRWSQKDLFPIIARTIEGLHSAEAGFVTHDTIVAALLEHAEASARIESARQESRDEHSREWLAHNMVAWFSQRISVEQSDWADRFDRQKIDGKWAYKPTF